MEKLLRSKHSHKRVRSSSFDVTKSLKDNELQSTPLMSEATGAEVQDIGNDSLNSPQIMARN